MIRLATLALALGACTPYLWAGYDATSHVSGPLEPTMHVSPQEPQSNAYSFTLGGWFVKRVGVEADPHLIDTSGQMNLASASLELRARWLARRFVFSDIHAGPSRGVLVDRMSGYDTASGYRAGATVGTQLGPLTGFVDLYTATLDFDAGPAAGGNRISGVTLGLGLR